MEDEETDRSISMAIHFLCSALEKNKKMVDKLATALSNEKNPDEIYMFMMALGAGIMGLSTGLSKLDKNFPKFASKLCKNLNTDDTLGV